MVVTLIIENLLVFLEPVERTVVVLNIGGNLVRPPPFRAAEKRQFPKSCHQF
jgi:hypothetical protein